MKVKVLEATGQLIKDIRTPDGWLVHIIFSNDAIAVRHIRKEESVVAPPMHLPVVTPGSSPSGAAPMMPQNNNFEIQWQLTITFDRALHDIRSTRLEVLGIQFRSPVDPVRHQQISQALQVVQ